jgi:hypothetical protein
MDTSRDILYRGFLLNDSAIADNVVPGDDIGSGISGCKVSSVDFSDVDVVQYQEKRSEQDGMDAGSVFLGARRIRMSGTLYGLTRALLFDAYWSLRSALSPVLAQRESPADKGYRPLYFSVPTNRVADYPAGAIDLQVLAMPRAFQAVFDDDAQGGDDEDSLAIPWQATFLCKDPSITADVPQDYVIGDDSTEVAVTGTAATDLFSKTAHGLSAGNVIRFTVLVGGAGLTANLNYYVISDGLTADAFKVSLTAGGSAVNFTTDVTAGSFYRKTVTFTGNTVNRGTYLAPLNMLLVVGNRAGLISVQAGDSVFSLTLPASTGNRTIRVDGARKIVTVEESGVEVTRMDIITFTGSYTWALIPAGSTGYSVSYAGLGLVDDSSHMWYWESYA